MRYLDNIHYRKNNPHSIEDELHELKQILKQNNLQDQDYELYQGIKKLILNEIKTEQLAITKITGYFEQLVDKNEFEKLKIILHFINCNKDSYQKMADNLGLKRTNLHKKLSQYADQEIWLKNLFYIKGMLDRRRKNYNNTKKNNEKEKC